MGDRFFVDKMVKLFVVETMKDISSMSKHLNDLSYNKVSSIAHKIKPSISHLCINKMYEEVRDIELWKEEDEIMKKKTLAFIGELELLLDQLREI
jgi:hypothetical protein